MIDAMIAILSRVDRNLDSKSVVQKEKEEISKNKKGSVLSTRDRYYLLEIGTIFSRSKLST